jgi:hypothetical protein
MLMKRVYEVKLQHKKYANDNYSPWILARSSSEAQRKSKVFVKEMRLPASQMEVVEVKLLGTIEVE